MSGTEALRTISRQTARWLVLGRQGLWPGRRYAGKQGVAEAIRASECISEGVQVDTISAIARFHDAARLDTIARANQNNLHRVLLDNIASSYAATLL